MLNLILIIVGSLVGLILLMACMGLMLPKEHVAASRIVLNQPPDAVWNVLADWEQWPNWNKSITRMERGGDRDGKPVWVMHSSHGEIPLAVEELTAPRRIVTRIAGTKLPFGGRWTYDIEPTAAGCRVTITENGEVYNPLFRFLSKTVFGYHATLEGVLKSLGQKFGESPRLERIQQ